MITLQGTETDDSEESLIINKSDNQTLPYSNFSSIYKKKDIAEGKYKKKITLTALVNHSKIIGQCF